MSMAISDHNYNTARAMLARAGGLRAAQSHDRHTGGAGSPDAYGQQLLQEARDDFRGTDGGGAGLRSGMNAPHYAAVHRAANVMGLQVW
jgi:hypothetical protein